MFILRRHYIHIFAAIYRFHNNIMAFEISYYNANSIQRRYPICHWIPMFLWHPVVIWVAGIVAFLSWELWTVFPFSFLPFLCFILKITFPKYSNCIVSMLKWTSTRYYRVSHETWQHEDDIKFIFDILWFLKQFHVSWDTR